MKGFRFSLCVAVTLIVTLFGTAAASGQAAHWDGNGPTAAFFNDQANFLLGVGQVGSVAVLVDGVLVWTWSDGWYRDSSNVIQVNGPATMYNIASLSKVITAQALLKSLDDNGVPLSTKIGNILVGFNLGTKGMGDNTLEQLLGMVSSIPDYISSYTNPYVGLTDQQVLDLVKDVKMAFPTYSNTNYRLAEFLLKQLESSTYTAYVKANFLDPECDTMLNWPFNLVNGQYLAVSNATYSRGLIGSNYHEVAPHHYTGGAGGISCTARGFARTIDSLMMGFTGNWWNWQEAQRVRNHLLHYGLGLTVYFGGHYDRVGHNGLVQGSTAQMFAWENLEGHQVVLVGLANNYIAPTGPAMAAVARHLENAAWTWAWGGMPPPGP